MPIEFYSIWIHFFLAIHPNKKCEKKSVETKSENGTQNTSCKLQSHVGPANYYLVTITLSGRRTVGTLWTISCFGLNLTEIGGEPKRMTVGASRGSPFTRYLKKNRWWDPNQKLPHFKMFQFTIFSIFCSKLGKRLSFPVQNFQLLSLLY